MKITWKRNEKNTLYEFLTEKRFSSAETKSFSNKKKSQKWKWTRKLSPYSTNNKTEWLKTKYISKKCRKMPWSNRSLKTLLREFMKLWKQIHYILTWRNKIVFKQKNSQKWKWTWKLSPYSINHKTECIKTKQISKKCRKMQSSNRSLKTLLQNNKKPKTNAWNEQNEDHQTLKHIYSTITSALNLKCIEENDRYLKRRWKRVGGKNRAQIYKRKRMNNGKARE